jgi:hypothetical protein
MVKHICEYCGKKFLIKSNCEEILARRAINSKNPESKIIEVIIYN